MDSCECSWEGLDFEVEFDYSPEEKGDYYNPPIPPELVWTDILYDPAENLPEIIDILQNDTEDEGWFSKGWYQDEETQFLHTDYEGLEIVIGFRVDIENQDDINVNTTQVLFLDILDTETNGDQIQHMLEYQLEMNAD